ncbi:hypothetical protein ACFXTN_008925 [Malus domestica]
MGTTDNFAKVLCQSLATILLPTRVKEQYHCWIIGKSLCVNLCASWQGRLANMPNLYSHSRKHSQQDCLLQNRRGTVLRISRARLST